jgi:hypothetical protein
MKPFIHPLSLVLSLLCLGCTSQENELPSLPPPVSTTVLEGVSIAGPAPAASSYGTPEAHSSGNLPPAPKMERDAERRTELADQTEKVYLRWNAALGRYRQTLNRWPANLQELQQHEPSLAGLTIPDGFQLQLDRSAGEIYLTRTVSARSAPVPPPPTILMAPLAIPY